MGPSTLATVGRISVKVKRAVDPNQRRVFDLYGPTKWWPADVARALGSACVACGKKEVEKLERFKLNL